MMGMSDLALVIDITKSMLNKAKLVKRMTQVRGKNGKIFTRMQWVDPNDKRAMENSKPAPGSQQSTYAHHEDGIREMERRQSNKFPVVHHPVDSLRNTDHNYLTDDDKYKEAHDKYKKGEKLPPIKINHRGDVIDNHHLLDLARKEGLSHIPAIVLGNPVLKKKLEKELQDDVRVKDENTGKEQKVNSPYSYNVGAKYATDVDHFKNVESKKYTRQYIISEAERQGINFKKVDNQGRPLPEDSPILWMRAYTAICQHIGSGKPFEITPNKKDANEKAKKSGESSVDSAFRELVDKIGTKQKVIDWAEKRGIGWRESSDPSINWMRAATSIKRELGKGKMLEGIRTRSKEAMEDSNLIISDTVRDMVKALGKKYNRTEIMDRADHLGIEYDKFDKKGNPLPEKSPILWMRAASAIQKYIAKGNDFHMKGEDPNGSGITANVNDTGDGKLTKMQKYAVDLGKRNSQHFESESRKWALKAFQLDFGVDEGKAKEMYEEFMKKARNTKLMMHFDPFEMLTNGVSLIDEMETDGVMKNNFLLDRGFDKEHKEANESDLYGDDYNEADDAERPVYGVADLYNHGLKSSPYGEVALVFNDDLKKRSTGTPIDSNSIPYGKEGKLVYSMEDPHHLLVNRWYQRWKRPKNPDAQRKRAIESVMNGTPYRDDTRYFESQISGDVDFRKHVEKLVMPSDWKSSKDHKDKHDRVLRFAKTMNIPVTYE